MDFRAELKEEYCPVCITQNVIAGKWKIIIIWQLRDGCKRFNQLQKAMPGIRQGYLTQQLRELEQDGLIHREVYREVPPRVEYSLTDMGGKFMSIVDQMAVWGLEYIDFVAASSNPESQQRLAGIEAGYQPPDCRRL